MTAGQNKCQSLILVSTYLGLCAFSYMSFLLRTDLVLWFSTPLILSLVFRKVNLLIGLQSRKWARFFCICKDVSVLYFRVGAVCSLIIQENGSNSRSLCLMLQWGKKKKTTKLEVACSFWMFPFHFMERFISTVLMETCWTCGKGFVSVLERFFI